MAVTPTPIIETASQAKRLGPVKRVRPKGSGEEVQAHVAMEDGAIPSSEGSLHYRRGEHYIVTYADGSKSAVRGDIFEATYRKVAPDLYRKRTDIELRCVVADEPLTVETLEGARRADAGDWIMIGVRDEIWPVGAEEARRKYAPAGPSKLAAVAAAAALGAAAATGAALVGDNPVQVALWELPGR